MKRLRAVFCALFGHARVYEMCIGYVHCARCGAQVGDTIAGVFMDKGGVSCPCTECEAAWKRLPWLDRFLCAQPKWEHLTPDELQAKRRLEVAAMIEDMQAETAKIRARREAREAKP